MKYILPFVMLCCMSLSATAAFAVTPVVIDTVLTDENVSYKVTQDETNLHLNISTSDEKTIMSMLHLGVSVFFDIKGKKRQNVFVKYPLEAISPNRQKNKSEKKEHKRYEDNEIEDEESIKKRITKIIESGYSQKAEYSYFDTSEEFNILLNNLDMSLSFKYDENSGLFEYDLQIPKYKINTDSKKDLSNLTIGVKTSKQKTKQNKDGGLRGNLSGVNLGGGQGGGRSSGRQGNGPPGGRKGGGPSGKGGQGGQRGGSPDSGRPTQTMLDFWFEAN